MWSSSSTLQALFDAQGCWSSCPCPCSNGDCSCHRRSLCAPDSGPCCEGTWLLLQAGSPRWHSPQLLSCSHPNLLQPRPHRTQRRSRPPQLWIRTPSPRLHQCRMMLRAGHTLQSHQGIGILHPKLLQPHSSAAGRASTMCGRIGTFLFHGRTCWSSALAHDGGELLLHEREDVEQ